MNSPTVVVRRRPGTPGFPWVVYWRTNLGLSPLAEAGTHTEAVAYADRLARHLPGGAR
ncbi:hypothetical protein EDD28_2442 [Salana multivorans]|uniref:Uncharacterized protein n=1 Tax=Salana multivorans TaxID=120377 RepID=A0A3N2D2P6_9MICO|nr:hypothetical protein [Salana multivorans]ROR94029.1 hypothetical protein EDD28_3459 [Salana multivorans]ROR97833.1 hypothetical protein EDD28_2442 [Salana multivorans]